MRTGDKLFFYHLQQGSAQGGMILTFSDGTNTGWAAQDQDGSYDNVGTVVGQWHARTVDLSAYAGKTINQFLVGNSSAAPVGTWNAWYSDIAILSADGTVTPVYTGQTSASFQYVSTSSPLASNLSASVTHDSSVGANAQLTTSYYHGDQIGSSRLMTAGTGWPTWQGTFLPFGEEYSPQTSTNHYKFTGKERDSESGLDYFGARYYGSALGRFITSDWSAVPTPVPYANFGDPQSLNQYSYVRNIPSTRVDPDGHCCATLLPAPLTWGSGIAAAVGSAVQSGFRAVASGAGAVAGVTARAAGTVVLALGYLASPGTTATADKDEIHFSTPPSGTATGVQTNTPPSQTTTGVQTNVAPSTSQAGMVKSQPSAAKNTPRSDLPRDKAGNYQPHADAQGAHTVIGTRVGSDGVPYRQGATFDENGNFAGRTDVTDHGRADHANPHFHPATGPNSVKPGPGEPVH